MTNMKKALILTVFLAAVTAQVLQARGQRFTISGKIDGIVKGDTLRFGRITLPGWEIEHAFDIVVEKPEVKFDYTFMILPEGRFAEDNTLPDGIVYQIQLFSLSSRTSVKNLKGLSPVFEEITPAGRYIYRVGVFRTYNDVLSNLNKVKKLGFRTAYVTAFSDGTPISVSKARSLEKKTRTVSLYQVNIVPYDGVLPELAVSAITQICGKKDIARTEKDGKIMYIVGTFDDRSVVEKVVVAVRAAGVADVSYVKTGTREATQ